MWNFTSEKEKKGEGKMAKSNFVEVKFMFFYT